MRRFARSASVFLLLLGALGAAPAAVAAEPTPLVPVEQSTNAVPGHYIVTVKPEMAPESMTDRLGITPQFTYNKVMHGFAAELNPMQLDAVRRMPGVSAIEQDGVVTADETAQPRVPALSWGLNRINQRFLPLNGQFNVDHDGAEGVKAYILDTGIDFGHTDFGGRAIHGFDAIGDGRNGQDCNGHGTHVAGTVGGTNYGVAREVTLVAVRVLGCNGSGSFAGVIAGIDWVSQDATQPAVLNASLGGGHSATVNAAINNLAAFGVLPVVAAGNSHVDACGVSPAGAKLALTVGATDINDNQAGFSNFGPCLTMFAPGVDIISDKLGGGTTTLSGTSMASPHVCGIAALLKKAFPNAGAGDVKTYLAAVATPDVLNVSSTSPNLLAYTAGL